MSIEASDRYRRAKTLACAALELAPEARSAFLRAECAGDEALHEEAQWLLDAMQSSALDDAPELPLRAIQAAGLGVESSTPSNYRLLGLLGEGGMGVVYLAERTDGDLGQRVALKLLSTNGDPDRLLARRFASERRILAGLVHPNIAHLVDAGISAEGRPFLAMEYVDGERIDAWCASRETSLKQRIELFLKVCAAVEYAHRHLVIHRDIKPANILVTADGEPKLLDFGIARLLDDDASNTRTETGLRALTLAYASPEQIEGAPLGTATDVYSLGIVLYQLVTGARPFDHLESAHRLSIAIVSGEITPPSRQTRRHARDPDPSGLRTGASTSGERAGKANLPDRSAQRPMRWHVPADVDAIILKALRREPAQRYASVAELADDLRRFLASRPVLARRGRWPYHARRFAWRWRWALGAGVTIVALLAGFGLDRQVQLERVAEQRDRAQALVAFMSDLFENADSLRSRGNEVTVREMLDRGARELVDRRGLSPAERSALLFAMGRAYNALGLGDQALPLLQSARALLGPDDGSAVERAAVLAELAAAYSTRRDAAASIAADRDAIELLRGAPGDHDDEITRLRIRVLQNHVNLLDIPLADAREQLRTILAELKARTDPPDTLLLQTYRALAAAYGDQSDGREAVEMARHALAIAERLYAPNDPRILPNRNALATAMRNVDTAQAARLYEALAADYERIIGPGIGLASLLNNQGILLSELGHLKQGIAVYRRAADIALAAAGREHRTYLVAISNLATLYSRDGQPRKAKALIEDVMPSFAAQAASGSGMNRVNYAAALDTLAASTAQLGDPLAAIDLYARAEQQLAEVDSGAYPEIRAEIFEGLAASQLRLGRHADARRTLDRLDALNRPLPPDHERRRRADALRERLGGVDAAPTPIAARPVMRHLLE